MWANLKGNTITNVMQLWQNTVIQITELRETLRDTKYRWLLKNIEPLMKLLFLKHPDFLSLHLKMTPSFGRWGTGGGGKVNRTQTSTKNLTGNKIILWTHFLYQTSLFSDNPAVILCFYFFKSCCRSGVTLKKPTYKDGCGHREIRRRWWRFPDSICNYNL